MSEGKAPLVPLPKPAPGGNGGLLSAQPSEETYLIWSHEHGAWWGPFGRGYVTRISEAGRYDRRAAMMMCARAIPGTAERMGRLPELPVRASDLEALRGMYVQAHHLKPESWE
jgi:hypothetical protein